MFKKVFIFLIVISISCQAFYYPKNDNSLGLVIGTKYGINYKTFLDKQTAIDLTYSQAKEEKNFHIDVLSHNYDIFSLAALSVYYGVGLIAKQKNKISAGVRFVAGVDFLAKSIPFDFFFEVSPSVVCEPDISTKSDILIGFRYWFNL